MSAQELIAALNAEELLDALQDEREEYTKANENVMQAYIDALIECGEYPKSVTGSRSTHLSMVKGYGVTWHRYSGPLECLHCRTDLKDHVNGPPFKREIGIYSTALDRTTGYKCPDCDQMISER